MAVIAIVIAIIVPTLGGARNTAKAAATQAQLTEIGSAAQQYYTDTTRQPGYFTARQMGDMDNETRGFTGMQNVMLDLAGGFATTGSVAGNVVSVGPISGEEVDIDLTLIGTQEAGGGYYTPDDKRFLAQEGTGDGVLAGIAEHTRLPSVVDTFGTPILAWQQDNAIQPIATVADFVQDTYTGDVTSRYYLASNAGLLGTGKRGKSAALSTAAPTAEHSTLGRGVMDDKRWEHLMILLGSPTVPNEIDPTLPSATRGKLVFHSGGIDAIYMGTKDKGGRASELEFWQSFYTDEAGGQPNRLVDRDGKVESIDLLDQFDDMIESVGN
jgi:type II secretory pathway pseudopilin PulG